MTDSIRWMASAVAAGSLFLSASSALAAPPDPTPVTTCGQIVKGDAVLTGDLDCSGEVSDEPTVVLRNATLDLAGFTLTGRTLTGAGEGVFETVACRRNCTILGPGTIVGSPVGTNAVVGFGDWAEGNRLRVVNATVTGGEFGVYARKVDASGATISNNRSVGIWTLIARVEGSTVTDNGLDTDGFQRVGIFGQVKSRVEFSTVTGNGMAGVQGWKLRIDDSTVTGNNAFADCATKICADLSARFALKVGGGTCDTSLHENDDTEPYAVIGLPIPMDGVPSWGVCSLD